MTEEFRVHSFRFPERAHIDTYNPHSFDELVQDIRTRNMNIESLLNEGWRIYDKIICPPNVMIIFSRTKKSEE